MLLISLPSRYRMRRTSWFLPSPRLSLTLPHDRIGPLEDATCACYLPICLCHSVTANGTPIAHSAPPSGMEVGIRAVVRKWRATRRHRVARPSCTRRHRVARPNPADPLPAPRALLEGHVERGCMRRCNGNRNQSNGTAMSTLGRVSEHTKLRSGLALILLSVQNVTTLL